MSFIILISKISLLPKWAQAYIANLHSQLTEAQNIIDFLNEDIKEESLISFSSLGEEHKIYLPKHCQVKVKFNKNSQEYIEIINRRENKIEIRGLAPLSISPRAVNSFYVGIEK